MKVFLLSVEATPWGHLLKWKLTPQKHPCGHHVHGRHGHRSPVKIVEDFESFCKKKQNFDPHFKNLYLARKWIQRAHIGIVWKLVSRATHSVLKHFWSDHLLEQSKAVNERQKTLQWPWKTKVLSTGSKFRLCASLKTCDLQILGNA